MWGAKRTATTAIAAPARRVRASLDGLAGARMLGGGGASVVGLAADEDPGLGSVGVVSLRDAAEVCEEFQVLRAREAGWSWARIGAVLGVSAQAVHKKHAGSPTRR
jgi:hypothetical protein